MTDPIEFRGLQPRIEFDRPLGAGPREVKQGSFADLLTDAVQSVDESIKTSERGVQDLIAGKTENVHDVMISMQRAQLSFQMMVEVRNRAIEAYHEISRMQI